MMNKALSVLAVVAILGASFFAGQKSFAVVEYEHTDVVEAMETCGAETYIGGCKDCAVCAAHEYKAGGCSYFKDTLCTLCTVLPHCPKLNVLCESEFDEQCTKCDERYFVDHLHGSSCSPCTMCGADEYVATECQDEADTVCAACPECGANEYVSRVCKVDSEEGVLVAEDGRGIKAELPTQCKQCQNCLSGSFSDEICDKGSIHLLGAQNVCKNCEDCETTKWTSAECSIDFQGKTECTDCQACEEGKQYITQGCANGGWNEIGTNTMCADCTLREDGQWTIFPCNSLHTRDAVHASCSTCVDGEYKLKECTEFTDTVCPACPDSADTISLGDPDFKSGLKYCKKVDERSMVRCEAVIKRGSEDVTASPSKCGFWASPISDQSNCRSDKANCGAWTSNCEAGFSGQSCCYHKKDMNCGTLTSRERSGIREGFEGNSEAKFVDFCRDLCDNFPDCMAFEVKSPACKFTEGGCTAVDGGFEEGKSCFFKSSYSQDEMNRWMGADKNYDCYSNTCRQNDYTAEPNYIINYQPTSTRNARRMSTIMGGRRR